jgi:Flp pilus assembly protein protease CpaA
MIVEALHVETVRWGVVIAAATLAAITDLRDRRIPNALTLPTLAAGLVAGALLGGWIGAADALAGCLALGLPYVLLFVFARGGGGDAKLMAAIGAWLGLIDGLIVLLCVALCGALFAAIHLWWSRRTERNAGAADEAARGALAMPYGVAICGGVLAAVIASGLGGWSWPH